MKFKEGQIIKSKATGFLYRIGNSSSIAVKRLIEAKPVWQDATFTTRTFEINQIELAPPLDQIKYRLDKHI